MNLATSATTFAPAIQQYSQYLNFLASQPNSLAQLQGDQLNTLINNADQLVIASEKSLQTLNSISRTIQNQYLNMATNLKSTIQSYGYGERYNNPAQNAQQKALLASFLTQYGAIKIPCRSTGAMGKSRATFCRLYETIESEFKEIERLSLQNDFSWLLKDVEKYNNRQDLTISPMQVKQNLSELQIMASDPITKELLGINLMARYNAANQAHLNSVAEQAIRQEQVLLSSQFPGYVPPAQQMQTGIQTGMQTGMQTGIQTGMLQERGIQTGMQQTGFTGIPKGIGSFGQQPSLSRGADDLKPISADENLSRQFREANLAKKRRSQVAS